MRIKCLSVCQPWAWAIVHGEPAKTIENRTWATEYRGPLAIHASKSTAYLAGVREGEIPGLPPATRLVFGAVVGVVELVDCVPLARVRGERYAEGPWCWVLERRRALRAPVPMAGRLGLYEIDLLEDVGAAERAEAGRSGMLFGQGGRML